MTNSVVRIEEKIKGKNTICTMKIERGARACNLTMRFLVLFNQIYEHEYVKYSRLSSYSR